MFIRRIATLSFAASLLATGTPAALEAQERIDHRDDFRMNSISGGDFRGYISDHIHEDDHWGHAMRMFGTFHNHMHEMMTHLALYAAERRGDDHRIPDFDSRISGGGWADYRAALEEDGVPSAWRDFVQITEIMHDRVHHAMYKSTGYDRVSRVRDADLDVYIGEDRAPYAPGETVLRPDQVNTGFVSLDRFREFVWHEEFEDRHFHAAMQAMMAFDEMLYALLSDWAAHGARKKEATCRPPAVGARVTPAGWHEFAERVEECGDAEWRHFVQVVALMHDRIHHMLCQAMVYHAAAHHGEAGNR